MRPKNELTITKDLTKQDKLSMKFPGLAIPNDVQPAKSHNEKKLNLSTIKEDPEDNEVEDAMAALEALAPSKE